MAVVRASGCCSCVCRNLVASRRKCTIKGQHWWDKASRVWLDWKSKLQLATPKTHLASRRVHLQHQKWVRDSLPWQWAVLANSPQPWKRKRKRNFWRNPTYLPLFWISSFFHVEMRQNWCQVWAVNSTTKTALFVFRIDTCEVCSQIFFNFVQFLEMSYGRSLRNFCESCVLIPRNSGLCLRLRLRLRVVC